MEDSLSKEGLQLVHGQWHILEYSNGDHFEYYHRAPFHESPGILDSRRLGSAWVSCYPLYDGIPFMVQNEIKMQLVFFVFPL